MDNFAITAADAVSRRYKSNDPEAIIAQRTIKIKDIRFCEELLGFYTVLLNCEYIGINPNCSKQQRRSALAHELGHAIFDRKHAASGQAFQDTYFYSLSNAKAERRANTFAAELLLSDDDVLKPIGFYEFNADRLQMEASLPTHCSSTYRALKGNRIELSEEGKQALSQKISQLRKGQELTIKYFTDGYYENITGILDAVDAITKELRIYTGFINDTGKELPTIIAFEDILEIGVNMT